MSLPSISISPVKCFKYHDKPDISFVDFTSMVVMQDLGIQDVFTGDAHFRQVNLGFRLVP